MNILQKVLYYIQTFMHNAQPHVAVKSEPVMLRPAEAKLMAPEKDRLLSPNFSLLELTQTSNVKLQARNRGLTDEQVIKLMALAVFMEGIRKALQAPIVVHSGYRCPELNGATAGSALKSQHMLCEACDFHAGGMSVDEAFLKLWRQGKSGNLAWGQLIHETKGSSVWVHVSMGRPYRATDLCGQVLKLVDGKGRLLERIPPIV